MKKVAILILKAVNILVLIIFSIWFSKGYDFEPLIGVVVTSISLLGLEYWQNISEQHNPDEKLFKDFLDVLPSNRSIAFIDRNNMAGFSFEFSRLGDLTTFIYTWNDAEHEFLSKKLEKGRKELLKLIDDYLLYLGRNTFPTHRAGWQSVPPEWEIEESERFDEVVNNLYEKAGVIVSKHQDFVRLGKKLLKI